MKIVFSVDLAMALIMGFQPESIPLSALALSRGLTPSLTALEFVGDATGLRHQFVAPRSMLSLEDRLPPWLVSWGKSHLTARPEIVSSCIGCGRCALHCPPQAMHIEGGRVHIDDKKCIRCYCCQELCPENAVQLNEGLLLKVAKKFQLRVQVQKQENKKTPEHGRKATANRSIPNRPVSPLALVLSPYYTKVEKVFGRRRNSIQRVSLHRLRSGMLTSENIYTAEGQLLIKADTEIKESYIRRLRGYRHSGCVCPQSFF